MEGSQGYLLVKLGAAIHISGVSFQLGRAVKDPSSAPRLVSVSADPYFEPILNASLPRRASEVVTFMLPHVTSTTHSLVKIEVSFAFTLESARNTQHSFVFIDLGQPRASFLHLLASGDGAWEHCQGGDRS